MTISVDAINKAFPRYPVTVSDKNWIYGVWYCGTSFKKVTLHGQYPPTFLNRALALFPTAKDILHAPSGQLKDVPGITLDIHSDDIRQPDYVGDCAELPFDDESFDLILSDPPYTKKDSQIYGCKPFPMGKFVREAHRTLRPGGYLGMLHTCYPAYRRSEFKLVALIAVVTGFWRVTRIFSVLEKMEVEDGTP